MRVPGLWAGGVEAGLAGWTFPHRILWFSWPLKKTSNLIGGNKCRVFGDRVGKCG